MRKKNIVSFLALLLVSIFTMNASPKHTFEVRDGNFMLDNKPFQIISGEMHFERIPYQYWRQRLQMLKAMGANTVATYVFWNELEPKPDEWNFKDNNDIAQFIKIAQQEGLYVILRPGPYACAEWDFGGFPWWLQNIKGMDVRSDNQPFLERTQNYLNHLYAQVKDLQITNGGPILMVQVENEFGSYAAQRKDLTLDQHKRYNQKIKQQVLAAGFNVPLFTADGDWLFEGGSLDGALPTANGELNIANLKKLINQYHNGKGPYMIGEFYSGWLTHWTEKLAKFPTPPQLTKQTETFLKNGVSFNFYMVHGGTNFGFTSGANYDAKHPIEPDITSYDYDAPISEAGWRTVKYDSLRNLIQRYVSYKLPAVPKPFPVIEIPSIKLDKIGDLLSIAEKQNAVESDSLLTFEQLNQGQGYVLYTRHFNQPISGKLNVPGLRDYAMVYVDGVKVGELNRVERKFSLDIDIPFNSTLEILVENMGRINYGPEMNHNHKGIISPITINDSQIDGSWEMYKLPMDVCPDLTTIKEDVYDNTDANAKQLAGKPLLYQGTFKLSKTGDTFLDMNNWGKGIVFINGHNLGRYWNVGPQQTLYVPGVWLKKGLNQIVIFEQKNEVSQAIIRALKTPILDRERKTINQL